MTPYYERDGITIYHADCRDVLPFLWPATVDLVLTDPPYGIGFGYGDAFADREDDYAEWLWPIIENGERLVRPSGHVLVYQAAKYARRWAEWFPRDYRLFALPKAFVQMRPVMLQWATDYALVWSIGQPPKGAKAWQPTNARDWHVSARGSTERFDPLIGQHPCPRPIDSTRYLVACLCPPNGLVLDLFMGSGTTLVAAKTLGRRAVGVEIEERYCEIAATRLAQGVLPLECV